MQLSDLCQRAMISSKIGAVPLEAENSLESSAPLKVSIPIDGSFNNLATSNDDSMTISKTIIARSAEEDTENSSDINDSEKPQIDNSDEITEQTHVHQHGSHGSLGPVKHLLNTVRERFHGNGGGPLGRIGAITSILRDRHEATTHESPIETEKDRTSSNSSTGLHVLEFLGTIFMHIWGFLSNIPALFANSSAALRGRQ